MAARVNYKCKHFIKLAPDNLTVTIRLSRNFGETEHQQFDTRLSGIVWVTSVSYDGLTVSKDNH